MVMYDAVEPVLRIKIQTTLPEETIIKQSEKYLEAGIAVEEQETDAPSKDTFFALIDSYFQLNVSHTHVSTDVHSDYSEPWPKQTVPQRTEMGTSGQPCSKSLYLDELRNL